VARGEVSTHVLVTSLKEVYERAASLLQDAVERQGRPGFRHATGSLHRAQITVALHPVGPSALAILMEEFARAGARVFLSLDSALALSPALNVGDVVIASAAIKGDGISRMYEPCEVPAIPDSDLMRLIQQSLETYGIDSVSAVVWTTDAYYLSENFIEQHLKTYGRIAEAVDMKTAPLYTLSMTRKLRAASVLIVDSSFPKGIERSTWINGEEGVEAEGRKLRAKLLDVIDKAVKPLLESLALHVEWMKSRK
jgi:uridine phosphorylase